MLCTAASPPIVPAELLESSPYSECYGHTPVRSVDCFRDLENLDRWKNVQLSGHLHVHNIGEIGHAFDGQLTRFRVVVQNSNNQPRCLAPNIVGTGCDRFKSA